MPTNDERRQVAARLREEAERHCDGFDPLALMDALGIDMDAEPFCDGFRRYCDLATFETWNRLADLIEPEPPRTCQMELCDTGEWFTPECREEYLLCSNCKFVGYFVQVSEDADYWCAKPNFCPNCGAKVVEA